MVAGKVLRVVDRQNGSTNTNAARDSPFGVKGLCLYGQGLALALNAMSLVPEALRPESLRRR